MPRWVEVSRSEYPHEREGLAYLKEHLPDAPPYRAWTNFEFMDGQGRWHEVDALILGRDRLHLVELKHYSGTLAGNETMWLRNGTRQERSPLLLARRKAQRLASRIESELRKWAHENHHPVEKVTGWLPFTQEAVFLHGIDLKVDMVGVARSNLFGFPGRAEQPAGHHGSAAGAGRVPPGAGRRGPAASRRVGPIGDRAAHDPGGRFVADQWQPGRRGRRLAGLASRAPAQRRRCGADQGVPVAGELTTERAGRRSGAG